MTKDVSCQVAELAQEAQAVIDAHDHVERMENPDLKRDLKITALTEKLDGIEMSASYLAAKSAIGAMFQLCLIDNFAELLGSVGPTDSDECREREESREAIRRMCYSVLAYISAESGENPDDACGEYFLSRELNPHQIIEAAISDATRVKER